VGSEATSYRMRTAPGLDLHDTWAAGVASTLVRLRRDGAHVVVLADTPDLTFDPVDCLTAPRSRLADCIGSPHPGLAAANATTREVALGEDDGFLDTVSLLCLRDRCPTVVDQTMTYWNYVHVAPAWSAALAEEFRQRYRTQLDAGASAQR